MAGRFLLAAAGVILAAAVGACTQHMGPAARSESTAMSTTDLSPASRAKWFPAADMMRIGVYYYPEAWPQDQWERDIQNIKNLHMEFVHLGEFAWTFMEPEEGKFDFSWLDRVVKLCADNGLKVVLCTPSAAPPVWLSKNHPEVLMVDANGRRMEHGTRQQGNWSAPVYRAYVQRINERLAAHYADNPAVWGWQLDNELSHYGKEPSFDPDSQASFRAWLRNKYKTIDALNRDWGNAFWSQRYQTFEQVRLPNEKELVAQLNPHAILDSQRWFADEAAGYLRMQAETLRKHVGGRQWVTTNFMHDFGAVNPNLSAKDLELTVFTIYPAHGNLNEGPLGFRMGSAATLSFAHDFFRNINGIGGVMELQPGQVNWGDVNPQPYPGAVHLWIMRSFAAGGSLVCTYRYREARAGAEMYHYGLVGTDGVTPSTGGEQYRQAAQEVAQLRSMRNDAAVMPADYAARRTAFLYSFDNRWDIDNHKQNVAWNTYGHLLKVYGAAKRAGAPVDVITEDKGWEKYPFVVAPAYQLVDEKLVARWRAYVENGGNLVLTCRTGQKDRRGWLWEGPWAEPILDLIGAKISFYDTLPAPNVGHVKTDNGTYEWVSWGEILAPNEGTTVLATHTDHFYSGKPAAVTRKLGKGTVTYIGVDSQGGGLEAELMHGVYEQAGVKAAQFAEGFMVDWRDGFWIATNFSDKAQAAPVGNGKLIFGTAEVPPAGVTVWQPE
jgi:beta-galactosidase